MEIYPKNLNDLKREIIKLYGSINNFVKVRDLPRKTVYRLVNGECNPRHRTAIKVAKALGKTFDDLFEIR